MVDWVTIKELGEMLQHLLTQAEKDWEEGILPSQRAMQARSQLIGIYPPLTKDHFKQWEKSRKEIQFRRSNELVFQTNRLYFYLPPIEREARFVPVMTLDCHFSDRLSKFCIHILFLSVEDNHPYYCVGFRIETPENQNQIQQAGGQARGSGNHDFYHAQLLNKPEGMPGLDHLPDSQPSFPLVANCPVTLFLCILLTMYGRKFFHEFVTGLGSNKASQGYGKIKTWYGWQE
jgi:hypothetical protein